MTEEKRPRRRMQVEFSPEAFARMQEMKELAHAKNSADVLRKGLLLLDRCLKGRAEGYSLQLVKDGVGTELEII